MNRADLQTLADLRVGDAKVLLDGGRFAAAYYLLGYAVECALKASVAKQIRQRDFPDKQLILDSYTHDLEKLLRISGLRSEFDKRVATDKPFEVSWTTIKDWNENSRYDATTTEVKARDLFGAVTDPKAGVLEWLKTLW